ncbi:trigger factor [Defluviicoccus vanus]|uniref:Trigger factor n=2 Tax=Defluviicoccus vanus TaxID=111831 RepID=A0A7H1N4L9_9PROT|nr:trigger factor [Defluviicoccus vanus]
MQVTETKVEDLSREFKVTIPAAEIEQKFEQRLNKLVESVRLPGFRPGKVPVTLLRKRYGDSLRGEIIEETINESSKSVITDRGLRPALPPRVELQVAADSADLEYTLALEVLPEIEQPDFAQIALERLVVEPDESQVTATVERLANMVRGSQPVTEQRPATVDDLIVVDVVAPADPKPFGDGKSMTLPLDGDGPLPELAAQLCGAEAGETRVVTITFPADYGVADLAGTTGEYEMLVKELRQRDPLSLDDELAKKLGVESLEELTKDIREHHAQELKTVSRARLKRALLDQLDKLYSFSLPKGLVEREYETITRRLKAEDATASSAETADAVGTEPGAGADGSVAEVEASAGDASVVTIGDTQHSQDPTGEYYELAERRVRLGLVLAEVGQRNNLRVTPEEIGKAMVAEARRYPGQEKAVIDFLRNNAEAREAIAAPLLEEKVVDFILEMVKVEDRTVSAEDLLRADDDDTTFAGVASSSQGEVGMQTTEADGDLR